MNDQARPFALAAALLLAAAMPLKAEVVLSLPHIETTAGSRLTVPLTLSGEAVPGILSLRIRIRYDHSWLKLVEVRQGALIDAAGFMAQSNVLPGESPSESLLAISLAGTEPITGPGELVDLVFEVAPNAPSGAGAYLRFTDDVLANRGRPALSTQPGAIEIKITPELLGKPGDIDGNRAVNLDDFFMFADHFGEGRGVSKVPVAAAGQTEDRASLRVAAISSRLVTLALDLGSGVRGYALVLRHPLGAEIQAPKADQEELPRVLAGVLRQTEERVYLASYDLVGPSLPESGTEIQLQFSLPPGFAEGEIQLEELWTVDDNQQIKRLAEVSRVRLVPQAFSLAAPYPNPFNPAVQVPYALPERAPVKLQVYNVLGQRVKTLVDEVQEAGFYQRSWQGVDDQGRAVGSGIYFIRLEAGTQSKLQKVVLMK